MSFVRKDHGLSASPGGSIISELFPYTDAPRRRRRSRPWRSQCYEGDSAFQAGGEMACEVRGRAWEREGLYE